MPSSSPQPTVINSFDGIPLEGLLQAVTPSLGSVLLVHGFSVDMHEGGAFDRLAGRLGAAGVAVARVSFRGHGGSGGTQWGMTISGERLDLSAAYDWMTAELRPPYGIIAASFGAVATLLQIHALTPSPCAVVLLNPVLELFKVFVQPQSQWGRENFGQAARMRASAQGYVEVNRFKAGQVLLDEMTLFPENLAISHLGGTPCLIVHGTEDGHVPIESSRAAAVLDAVQLIEISGSGHGFSEPSAECHVFELSTDWIARRLREDTQTLESR